jgi:hypothetical protein
MSSVVKAKCPKCKNQISVEEEESAEPVTCSSCQTSFVPATVIAESNKRFEMAMYIGMLLIGVGLIVYMAMTGNLKQKADPAEAPPAAEARDSNQ